MNKIVISLVLSLLLVGPGLAQEGVTVWTHFGDGDLEWLQQEAAAFEGAFGVPVEIVNVDLGEIKQKMLLSAPEGEAADLVVPVPHDQIGEMAVGGVLTDMTNYATATYLEDLNEHARQAFTFNGKLFGLPMYVEGPALIVNNELVSEVPKTLELLIETAMGMSDGDQYGFLYDMGNFYFSYVWLRSLGGYVFGQAENGDLNPDDVGLANEGAVMGAKLLRDMRHTYELIPEGTDYGVADGLFIDGALGMIYNGPWAIANYRDAGLDVSVYPLPATQDGQEFSGFMGVQGILLNEYSEAKADSANFAKWLTRAAAQVALAERSGKIPSSHKAAAEIANDPVIAGFSAALDNAEPMPNIPEMGNVWGPMGDALTVILESGDSDIEGALSGAVGQILGE